MHVLCSMLCFSPHHVHLFLSQFYCMCFGVAQVFFCLVVSIWSCFILSTCPSHQICTVMSFVMFLLLVFKNSYWLFFFFFGAKRSGQFFCCGKSQVSPYLLTTCQFSEPYRRTDLTLLLYRSIFVLRLYCVELYMEQSWEKAHEYSKTSTGYDLEQWWLNLNRIYKHSAENATYMRGLWGGKHVGPYGNASIHFLCWRRD